jgi:hypothetical protein
MCTHFVHAFLALAPRQTGVVGAQTTSLWRVDLSKNRDKSYDARRWKCEFVRTVFTASLQKTVRCKHFVHMLKRTVRVFFVAS